MKSLIYLLLLGTFLVPMAEAQQKNNSSSGAPRITTANGIVEGRTEESGIRSFKGIPFAQPPVAELRWREPQPPTDWQGVRKADEFGPRAMQRPIFGDMNFRSDGMSEDCLYLNVWTPATSGEELLPVLVYFYGGGFMAGDGSEPRYDGESMAQEGIVTLTVNYRLGVFGFLAHPELTKDSPHNASGNYGLMDQQAALQWVKNNIAAFGGDPEQVTIAGESAGSYSVSAQMASPLSKDLISAAIAESGSLLSLNPPATLSEAEQMGLKFAKSIGANSLEALRAMPADELLETTARPETPRFTAIVDGYFFPKPPVAIFQAGEQAQVPLLAGWNSAESHYRAILGEDPPTPENYVKAVQKLYGEHAKEALELYPGSTEAEVKQSATDLAGDRFIGYSTWKLLDVHAQTTDQPVFRYYYARPRPPMTPEMGNATAGLAGGVVEGSDDEAAEKPEPPIGAVHSAEIEYAMGNLASNKVFDWQPEDFAVSKLMKGYFANFIKTANPNGENLPEWPAANSDSNLKVMQIDVNSGAQADQTRERYLFLERVSSK